MAKKNENVYFYVSPTGSNAWSGKSPTTPKSGKSGPLKTLAEVQNRLRALRNKGERRHRPRLPREGLYHINKLINEPDKNSWSAGDDRFIFSGKQFKEKWHNLNDVEVCVFNFWVDSRMKVAGVDEKKKLVAFDRKSSTYLMSARGRKRGAPFWIENIFEELKHPGQWYLDRVSGILNYLPLPEETLENTEIIAPSIEQLLLIEGKDLETKPAACIRFQGITFSHTQTSCPFEDTDKAQAACSVPNPPAIRQFGVLL